MNQKIHIVPGVRENGSGIVVASKLLAAEHGAMMVDAGSCYRDELAVANEVWVHSLWTFKIWRACWNVIQERKRLVRMLHGNVDPVRLKYHGWKKWLVGPIERYFLRKADVVVVTCAAEAAWIRAYEPHVKKVEIVDIKRFFNLNRVERVERVEGRSLHLLYLGRQHPLKGVEYLEEAVRSLESGVESSELGVPRSGLKSKSENSQLELRIVSNAFGEEKEKVWDWCDVLVLPTLSENFGLVIAEALEKGKRVITTDGAPAWGDDCLETKVWSLESGKGSIWSGYGGRLIYLKGYRDGSRDVRVKLLRRAIEGLCA